MFLCVDTRPKLRVPTFVCRYASRIEVHMRVPTWRPELASQIDVPIRVPNELFIKVQFGVPTYASRIACADTRPNYRVLYIVCDTRPNFVYTRPNFCIRVPTLCIVCMSCEKFFVFVCEFYVVCSSFV